MNQKRNKKIKGNYKKVKNVTKDLLLLEYFPRKKYCENILNFHNSHL